MTSIKKKRVMEIAKQVRNRIEKQNKVVEMFPQDLEGLCAIASVELFGALERSGFSPQVVRTDRHAYVVLNGYIVDITTTQFGRKEKVAILLVKTARRIKESWWWKNGKSADNIDDIERLFRNWDEQNPFETTFWEDV